MQKIAHSKIQKFAEKAGISIGSNVDSKNLTHEQLAVFAAEVQSVCAIKCLKIAQKHQQSRAFASKDGALQCYQALTA